MYGLIETKHFLARSQQRCIKSFIQELLLYYGESRKLRDGIDSIFFSRDSLHAILNDLGNPTFKMCEKFRNAYLILSEDGVLITIARSYRTIH